MSADVIVWNTDVRNRPELEVEIDIVAAPDDVPGQHYARAQPALEVEMLLVDEPPEPERLFDAADLAGWTIDALFDSAPELADDDLQVIYDVPPPGYQQAYRASC